MTGQSAIEETRRCLNNIERFDSVVNAFISVLAESALREAESIDRAREQGAVSGLLAGVPISVKDCIDVAGTPCTNGSTFFADYVPENDALVVQRLRQAGAVILGKTNLHEFAYGSTTQNPHYGSTRNPWDLDRIPSGSSGGAGASVAAQMCVGAVGSDTGGSVRTPAAINGVSGLRPSMGSIPMTGSFTRICPAIDTVGPLGESVEIVARMFAVMAGYDDDDLYSVRREQPDFLGSLDNGIKGIRIGLPQKFFLEDLEEGVGSAVEASAQRLAALGADIVEIELEGAEYAQQSVMPMVWADAYEYHRERVESAPEKFGRDVLDRILLGRDIAGCDYAAALRARERWNRTVDRTLEQVDVILTPTTPITAPLVEESSDMLSTTHHLTRFTYLFSWAGLPGLSVPCGFTSAGMPIGMLLNGRPWEETLLFQIGHSYQNDTDWHSRRPPLLNAAG
ncbi:MAG TPA: Asp-tRNA(Asn)/Glu-tRNA(Gln) amidotransferase subunit GatA [Gammaproteobacteria bacterium]|nr:Asp-tRNA(Asn)/Glu-tRNA(Gln) amidotransferase subunit GatA [Gammaproteobacteria bacterium]HIP04941.1 Asp-tRNA(Asn)/Glu-tRNA(Gln) amidotransferase subunit GatA [Gammaproteobacteria bacterium]